MASSAKLKKRLGRMRCVRRCEKELRVSVLKSKASRTSFQRLAPMAAGVDRVLYDAGELLGDEDGRAVPSGYASEQPRRDLCGMT
jgi:hypothetical protein